MQRQVFVLIPRIENPSGLILPPNVYHLTPVSELINVKPHGDHDTLEHNKPNEGNDAPPSRTSVYPGSR